MSVYTVAIIYYLKYSALGKNNHEKFEGKSIVSSQRSKGVGHRTAFECGPDVELSKQGPQSFGVSRLNPYSTN